MAIDEQVELLNKARAILDQYQLCDYCLGRLFGWLSTGMTNKSRGTSIKTVLSMIADEKMKRSEKQGIQLMKILAENGMFEPAMKRLDKENIPYDSKSICHLCSINGESIFSRIPKVKEMAVQAQESIEYSTFLVGSVHPPELIERQEELVARHNLINAETLRSHFNRELGRVLQESLAKEVDFERPDIVVVYNSQKDSVSIQINPMFIAGRYRKLVRGIPQSRWDCKRCRGKGCERCNFTGRLYPDSISEYVSQPMLEEFGGTRFKFHAAGREDIDALMLGTGRPFVVEISNPEKRTADLMKLEQEINRRAEGKIEVSDLKYSERSYAQRFMREASLNVKEYEAIIQVGEGEVSDDELSMASEQLSNIEIEQRTPLRVKHRRSDLVRRKWVYQVRLERIRHDRIKGFFRVQGGTYIKELISGDEGRTRPSLSEVLGVPCKCKELNVVAIYSKEGSDNGQRGTINDKP